MNDGMTQEVPVSAKARNILEAARALFIARGYEAASMDAVAKAANVSKATVYAYFNSKNELFAAIVARVADGLTREIGARMGGRTSIGRGSHGNRWTLPCGADRSGPGSDVPNDGGGSGSIP